LGDSDPIIQVENLGKKYLISHQQEGRGRYQSLRDTLTNGLRAAGRRLVRPFARTERPGKEEFWALKDVSFEVKRGEVVGIIGRNGAGKSTLLKILSRITEPTTGRVTLHGRVASLLEVGTGFHPELTGRENVYLNGAILGMSRAEIKKKFDEIVAFAEVEKFLDTPVKRYSSGMYMRLAFAVAAHLDPEILVVDEVLAVGDTAFQKKCLDRMDQVSASGRTVLFVSHNIGSLLSICQTGILLDAGQVIHHGSIRSTTVKYHSRSNEQPSSLVPSAFRGPLKSVLFEELILNGQAVGAHRTSMPGEELEFRVRGRALVDVPGFQGAFALFHAGLRLLTLHDTPKPEQLSEGPFEMIYRIPAHLLRPGEYSIALGGRRVAGDEWVWAADLAVVEIVEEWGEKCERDAVGIINLLGRGRRVAAPAKDPVLREQDGALAAGSES
jgi:lipopolysaccharide transport system ATP-binding protein